MNEKRTKPRSKYAKVVTRSNPYDVVMTPPHIAQLMAQLADPQPNSVIVDPTCGTGNLLAACPHGHLVGMEHEPALYAICQQNLPETARLYCGDSFAYADVMRQHQPTIGLVNPPYSKKEGESQSSVFVDCVLNCLQPGGTAIALVPIACGIAEHAWKARLMDKHTLTAVMTMPKRLFGNEAAVETILMVWHAHRPHDLHRPVWFASWKDDGFVANDGERVDEDHRWPARKHAWLDMYRQQHVMPGTSLVHCVGPDDEWCFEAHIATDYCNLSPNDFVEALVNNLQFSAAYDPQALHGAQLTNDLPLASEAWGTFTITELFAIQRGDSALRLRELATTADTGTPIISATVANNGVKGCATIPPRFARNCLTVANTGNGGGTAFYHQYAFDATGQATILRPTFAMPHLVGLFLAVIISRERPKYSYSRKLSVARLKETRIRLPVDATGQPDWPFMEHYMRRLRVASVPEDGTGVASA